MADTPPASPSPGPAAAETPAQEKARLRRERLAAKLATGGAQRLQQISALQGGPVKDLADIQKDLPVKPASAPRAVSGIATPDPDEVDISQHHYTPSSQPRQPSPFAFGNAALPNQSSQPPADPSQDPMMAMLQQMMGGAGAGAGGIPGISGMPGMPGSEQSGGPGEALPPGLANMFAAMNGGAAAPEPSPEQSSAWIWRLVHSFFSLALAMYIVFQTPFTGSKFARNAAAAAIEEDDWTADVAYPHDFTRFFYLFATFEIIMQSSRYFIEKGRLQGSGMLSTIAGILPPPYGGYVRTIGRYSVIYTTVVSDAMVVVFVLGATSWWKGAAAA